MRLSELIADADVTALCADPDAEISAIVSDSRRVVPGALFLCLRGTRTDGHRFLADAAARGAAAAVIDEAERARSADLPVVCVRDTRAAAARIWNCFYGRPADGMCVAAVTGTNGKTSVSWMLRAILAAAGRRVGMIGTVRCLCGEEEIPLGGGGEIADVPAAMTTPDPEYLYGAVARMRDAGADTLVLEASSHALDLRKTDALPVSLALFTNLSPEHLDYHKTMDAYLRAKARLFAAAPRAVVNADDEAERTLEALCPDCRFVRCSAAPAPPARADVRALRAESLGMEGVRYIFCSGRAVFRVFCPVPGRFSVYNSLLAAAAALELGVDPVTIQDALAAFPGVPGRMERVPLPGAPFSLFLDYAHTPAALESLLVTVRRARRDGERITLLFGCGGDRDPTKRPAMGRIASALADFVVVTSDNSRSEDPQKILADILAGVDREKPFVVIPDRREAIRFAVRGARPGDILLFAGKGHEKYEITRGAVRPFDEAAAAREAYAAAHSDAAEKEDRKGLHP